MTTSPEPGSIYDWSGGQECVGFWCIRPRTLPDHRLTCGYAVGHDLASIRRRMFPQAGPWRFMPGSDCGTVTTVVCTNSTYRNSRVRARAGSRSPRRRMRGRFRSRVCRAPVGCEEPTPADLLWRPSPVATAGRSASLRTARLPNTGGETPRQP